MKYSITVTRCANLSLVVSLAATITASLMLKYCSWVKILSLSPPLPTSVSGDYHDAITAMNLLIMRRKSHLNIAICLGTQSGCPYGKGMIFLLTKSAPMMIEMIKNISIINLPLSSSTELSHPHNEFCNGKESRVIIIRNPQGLSAALWSFISLMGPWQ